MSGPKISQIQRNTRYELNARGLLVARTDAADRVVRFGYDDAFRLASLTNENREKYGFQYDRRDLVSAQIDLDGHTNTTYVVKARSYAMGRSRRDTSVT